MNPWNGQENYKRNQNIPMALPPSGSPAHLGNITTSQDVQVVVKREFVEQLTEIMHDAAEGLENYHRVEGWPVFWREK